MNRNLMKFKKEIQSPVPGMEELNETKQAGHCLARKQFYAFWWTVS